MQLATDNVEENSIDIVSVRLVKNSEIKFNPKIIKSPKQVTKLFHDLIGDSDREIMLVCCLDAKNTPTNITIASIGSVSLTIAHPREIFKTAILSNASAIIMCHNHPSGKLDPSTEDKDLTKKISFGGKILGIELLDHIIIGDEKYYSFKENKLIGNFDELKSNLFQF